MKRNNNVPLWEQLPDETGKAYEAFLVYKDIGPKRTQQEVAKRLSKSRTLVVRWASKYKWKERAQAWDASIVEEARSQVVDDYKQMIERHIRVGQLLQKNAVEGLRDRDLSKASFHSLVLMMERGVEIERTARDVAKEIDGGEGSNDIRKLFENILQSVWSEDDNA